MAGAAQQIMSLFAVSGDRQEPLDRARAAGQPAGWEYRAGWLALISLIVAHARVVLKELTEARVRHHPLHVSRLCGRGAGGEALMLSGRRGTRRLMRASSTSIQSGPALAFAVMTRLLFAFR